MNYLKFLRHGKSNSAYENTQGNCLTASMAFATTAKVGLLLLLAILNGSSDARMKSAGMTAGDKRGGWVLVSTDDKLATYVYPSSIVKQGKLARMWSLINYRLPQSLASSSYLSEKSEEEYDCEKLLWRTLSFSLHSEPMGIGETVFSKSKVSQWQPIQPNYDSESFWKVACK